MITPAFARTMAAYNSEMNRRLYAAAGALSDAERRADRGAFWSSIHGTLCHLVWADRTWMSRFAGWPKPPTAQRDSATMIPDWDALRAARGETDAGIEAWTAELDENWLALDLIWFSGAAQREVRKQSGFVLAHFFNHQTHHRGQAHALLTQCGQKTGDTDLPIVVRGPL
jgi:uncharacterized damage-inducible protein DinB